MRFLTILFAILLSVGSNAQSVAEIGAIEADVDFSKDWTNYQAQKTEYPIADIELFGSITENITLQNTSTYLIKGNVYVENGATLSIMPGTVIRADKNTKAALIITKGSKIKAMGTPSDPIVFTSSESVGGRDAGDWCGIIILGDAPINHIGGVSKLESDFDHTKMVFGGDDTNSSSGSLKYVRVEFAGAKKDKTQTKAAAVILAGVGETTQVDYVQVSNSINEGFDFVGGRIMPENLVSYYSKANDFSFTDGYVGFIKHSLAIRHPLKSDYEGSSAVFVEGHADEDIFDTAKGNTVVQILNSTLVKLEAKGLNNPQNAVTLTNGAEFELKASIVLGFDQGIVDQGDDLLERIQEDKVKIQFCYVATLKDLFVVGSNEDTVQEWFSESKFDNNFYRGKSDWTVFRNATPKGRIDLRLDHEQFNAVVGN